MKDLRKRCEKLARALDEWDSFESYVSKIEAFAREIRNEALEKAAKITENRCGTSTIAVKEIRALKTDAPAAQTLKKPTHDP